MYTELTKIATFVFNAFLHIWPYLLITIPLSVAVKMSGAANYINRAFSHRPHISIILATVVGAFSPFCSCGVIPVVASLLLGGVPLAPVMSFWIASPSMDPEIFFLSVATLGWKLAIWRLSSTLLLSLASGYITHYIVKTGWLGQNYLTIGDKKETFSIKVLLKNSFGYLRTTVSNLISKVTSPKIKKVQAPALCCSAAVSSGSVLINEVSIPSLITDTNSSIFQSTTLGSSVQDNSNFNNVSECCSNITIPACNCSSTETTNSTNSDSNAKRIPSYLNRLWRETMSATVMVMKFMGLAFLLESIIELYVPQNLIIKTMGGNNPFSVLWAAILGVPIYTSNLAALPLIGGLLAKGMNQGAALAFLISGPVTTIPAMAAVYGLVNRKVFSLYVAFSFFGALAAGYLLYLVSMLI